MQFTVVAAVSALAAVASASYPVSNATVAYTTEIVTAYTTYCPAATEISHGGVTYTATEATTLTITNCPCTIVKPVTTSSAVYCSTCAYPTSAPAPVYPTTNATTPYPTKSAVGTSSSSATATAYPTGISSSGADKVAFSGAALAGLLAAAAYIL